MRNVCIPKQNNVSMRFNAIGEMVFSNKYLIMILFFPFFKNSGFDYISIFSPLCNTLIAVEFILFFPICLIKKKGNIYYYIIVFLMLWTYVLAPIISGYDPPSSFYFMGALGILSLFEVGFSYNAKKVLEAVGDLFFIMIAINYLLYCKYPNGLGTEQGIGIYFFGIRTGFSLYIIPGIMFNLLLDKYYKKKISIRTVAVIVIGTISLLSEWVVTGLSELIIIIVLMLLVNNKKLAPRINMFYITIALIACDVSLTVFGSKVKILDEIAILFNKDVTFSGRTYIWEGVVKRLGESPWAGYGEDALALINGRWLPAHNQWLHTAMEGGYIAMALLIIAVIISSIRLYKNKNRDWYKTVSVCSAAILVGTVTEIQTYVPFLYVIFDLPYLLERFGDSYKKNEEL